LYYSAYVSSKLIFIDYIYTGSRTILIDYISASPYTIFIDYATSGFLSVEFYWVP